MDFQASPSRLSKYVPFLLFCLTALQIDAFSTPFLLFHLWTYASRNTIRQSTPNNKEQEKDPLSLLPPFPRTILPGASTLIWSSVFLLSLPYILIALAFLIQASSHSMIDLSNHIPSQNAAAMAFECVFMALRASKRVHHVHHSTR